MTVTSSAGTGTRPAGTTAPAGVAGSPDDAATYPWWRDPHRRKLRTARPPLPRLAAHRRRSAAGWRVVACREESDPDAVIVFCHPLPTHGGSMDSHVIRKAAWRLPALAGIGVLRFNTRGTTAGAGTSEGAFDENRGEGQDLLAAVAEVTAQGFVDPWAVGWSFGTDVILRWGNVDPVAGAVLLSPPGRWTDDSDVAGWAVSGRPVTALVPELDEFASPDGRGPPVRRGPPGRGHRGPGRKAPVGRRDLRPDRPGRHRRGGRAPAQRPAHDVARARWSAGTTRARSRAWTTRPERARAPGCPDRFQPRPPGCRVERLLRVRAEAATGLAAEVAGGDQVLQQRRRREARLAELEVERRAGWPARRRGRPRRAARTAPSVARSRSSSRCRCRRRWRSAPRASSRRR